MMHYRYHIEVAHSTDGRVRLRVPARCGDAEFFAEAAAQIAELDGVIAVRSNRYSTSIVIEHDDSFILSSVTEALIAAAAVLPGTGTRLSKSRLPAMPAEGPHRIRSRNGTELAVGALQLAFAVSSGGSLVMLVQFAVEHALRAALRSRQAPALTGRLAAA